jgi:hypothetical protein
MYVEWMNQEQQRKQKGFVDLESGHEDAFTKIRDEEGEQCPSNNYMDIVPKTLAFELEEHDALSL